MEVIHLWGMTEMSPVGTGALRPRRWEAMTSDQQLDLKVKQGPRHVGRRDEDRR
jgi:hypothetical protein